jgi:hypothetical protein
VSCELEFVRVDFSSYLFEERHACFRESRRPETRHCPSNAAIHN